MNPNHPRKGWKDVKRRDVTSLLSFDVLLQVHGREDREADDEPIGDLQQGRDELGIPEPFDDERSEIAYGAVDHLRRHAEEEQKPGLGVHKSFDELAAFVVRVFDAGVVVPKSFDGQFLLLFGEPASVATVSASKSEDKWVQTYAHEGFSARVKNMMRPHAAENEPTTINWYRHDVRSPWICPIP